MASLLISFSRFSCLLGILWLCALPTHAQNYASAQHITQEDKIYEMAEQPPVPEGGLAKFYEYTEDNLAYPAEAKKKGVKGKIFVKFVVEKDGQISNIKIIKGLGHGCDEALIACLKSAPRWRAGKQGGKAVRVVQTMSIQIK